MSYCCRLPFAFDSFDGVLPASSACFPLWVFSGYLFVPGARWKVLRCICLSWVSSSFGVFLRRPPSVPAFSPPFLLALLPFDLYSAPRTTPAACPEHPRRCHCTPLIYDCISSFFRSIKFLFVTSFKFLFVSLSSFWSCFLF
jgi:hypothetical protein